MREADMPSLTALVQPYSRALDLERRASQRQRCHQEALTRLLDADRTLAWGATVRDISDAGIGLAVCFPFRAGAYLSVDVIQADGSVVSRLTRVVHAVDQRDGTWHVGCEFVAPPSDE
jgi:hypothetical protein